MSIIRCFLLSVLILFSFGTLAQDSPPLTKEEKKAKKLKNIHFINKNFMIRPAYSLQSNLLQITDLNGTGSPLNYRPNVWGSAGGQIKLGGLVLTYMYRLPVSDENVTNLGKTDYQNIGINIQTRYVGLKFDYINYTGFYLSDSTDTPVLPISDGYREQFPNLSYFSIGFKTTVAFNKKFSINAGFAQTERMKTSAGSFMFSIGDRFTKISSDRSFLPADNTSSFQTNFRDIWFNTTYVAIGAGHSWVKGLFSFTPIVLVGTGIQIQRTYSGEFFKRDVRLKTPLYFSFKNAISYNHDNFFVRIIGSAEMDRTRIGHPIFNETNVLLNMFYLNAEASLGVRFGKVKTKAEKKAKKERLMEQD